MTDRIKIKIHRSKKLLVRDAWKALSLFARMKGLLGTRELKDGQGLLIPDCKQVHTWFMKYPIDVIFLDSNNQVLKSQTLSPWKFSPYVFRAKSVLEVPAGFVAKHSVKSGEKLEVSA